MNKKTQRIIIPGEPVPKGRPRMAVTSHGKRVTYTPERTNRYAKSVEKWALTQRVKPMKGPLRVSIWFWIKRKGSWNTIDIDNLAKGILDPLNGIAWEDDKQIVDLLCFKRTDIADPLTDVIISEWNEDANEKTFIPEIPAHIKTVVGTIPKEALKCSSTLHESTT